MKTHTKNCIVILFLLIIFSGCKTTVDTEVKLTDLLNSKSKNTIGDLFVEITGCNDYKDSRQPSSSLIEAQQIIPNIFSEAKFIECFSKEFKSYVHFTIPITLDKDKDGKLASDKNINIISNEKTLLAVGIPSSIKDNLNRTEQKNHGMVSFDLSVNIKVINDTGKEFPFKVISAYIDDLPYVYGSLTSNSNGSFVIKLSDVSVDNALQNQTSAVLMF